MRREEKQKPRGCVLVWTGQLCGRTLGVYVSLHTHTRCFCSRMKLILNMNLAAESHCCKTPSVRIRKAEDLCFISHIKKHLYSLTFYSCFRWYHFCHLWFINMIKLWNYTSYPHITSAGTSVRVCTDALTRQDRLRVSSHSGFKIEPMLSSEIRVMQHLTQRKGQRSQHHLHLWFLNEIRGKAHQLMIMAVMSISIFVTKIRAQKIKVRCCLQILSELS